MNTNELNSYGNGVKWLHLPWQPLVTSDLAVLTAVEESLVNTLDANLIVHTCQFVTNVMLQDFPAEVFVQRPAIVSILQALLEHTENNKIKILVAVVKTLYKLTRSLRYRINYYRDPMIANKRPNIIFGRSESSWTYESSLDDRETPEGGMLEANYQVYQQQCTTSQESPEIIDTNIDDSLLQQQQINLPFFCTETLKNVLSQFFQLPVDSSPLRIARIILDLSWELVHLLITTLRPSVWLLNDTTCVTINENVRSLLKLLGELMEYFGPSTLDYQRIIYLHTICVVEKILCSIVPLELANIVIPKNLKICIAQCLLDAPLLLINQGLSTTLEQYARQFQDNETREILELFDEIRYVTSSLEAAIILMNDNNFQRPNSKTLELMWTAKSSFAYHKCIPLVRKFILFLQEVNVLLENEEKNLANKLILNLLAHEDGYIRRTSYEECCKIVSLALGVEARQIGKTAWIKVAFLLESSVITEIVCHGVAGEDERIKKMAEDIMVYILKGKIHMGDEGWIKFIKETLIPTFGLLQSITDENSELARCIIKMLDPDIYESIKIPYIEVLRGNSRLLYSSNSKIREEALSRLIFLLGREEDSLRKLPRLASLHGLPLSSLCIIDRPTYDFKRSEGNYQPSSILSVLELIKTNDVEPKVKKSALVQISVMLCDTSLHRLFVRENGLSMILEIMNKSLIENEYGNYPDSVIPILTILRNLASSQSSVRHDLSTKTAVHSNILRSLFLFPNNECVKLDASQLLSLLLYSEYMKTATAMRENEFSVASLPDVIARRMRLPLNLKSYWKTSTHRESNGYLMNLDCPAIMPFLRQFWYWRANNEEDILQKNSRVTEISEMLEIGELELAKLRNTSIDHCSREQLINIQNSTMHAQVVEALEYLTMYTKLWQIFQSDSCTDKFKNLPWQQSFNRFLTSQPTSKEDCDLFVDVVNFLYIYTNAKIGVANDWLCKLIRKNVTRSLSDLIGTMNTENQEIHEAVLKLVRSVSFIENTERAGENTHEDSWLSFVEIILSNLCFGDQISHEKQQHFYNLAYLDWLLRCLTYLIGKCNWRSHKGLLISLANTLIELIISFYGAGTVSFMGLSITRNSIICLNHLVHEMQTNFGKNEWIDFWYDEERNLSWLPILWKNRDPLVRASAFQLLSALTKKEHTAFQLLRAIALAPNELVHTLLRYFTNRDECCIVREQACTALSNMVMNSSKLSFQYMDSLKSSVLILYIEQSNIYYEISVLCSNVYTGATIEPEERDIHSAKSENSVTLDDEDDNSRRFVATPSLISIVCILLKNLTIVGGEDVAKHIYEQSLDKYFLRCFGDIPSNKSPEKTSLTQYCDVLEMYISLSTLLTNCITNCQEFALVAHFSTDTMYLLLKYLNKENYFENDERVMYLRKTLTTEIYNLLSVLSSTEIGQEHMGSILTSINLFGAEKVLMSICESMKDTQHESLRMSSIGCLAFILSLEIRRKSEEIENDECIRDSAEVSISTILDNFLVISYENLSTESCDFRKVLSSLNKISIAKKSAPSEKATNPQDENEEKVCLGSELSKVLINLLIAHNYARPMKKESTNISRDKDIIVGALSNLLCISTEAKKTALQENLGETCLMILRELQTEFSLQPYQIHKTKCNRDKKVHPLLDETKRVFDLLMNFMYKSIEIKKRLAEAGLADCLHKLWAWISLDDKTVTSALELVATFTTNCSEGTHSLTMTNATYGTGLRRTSNATSLIHTIINLICREMDKAGRKFDNQKLHFAFHILRNTIHVHECRVAISKSNFLEILGKIHPASTKRAKPWPLLEVYSLEFFNDFTFYEEGQISVARINDGLDVLIELGRSKTPATRLLAISTLRNLVFNPVNRSRLLSSAAFINLLRSTFETGTFNEIGITGSILWSLVANNQKGKLTIRSAGFSQCIQEVLGRLSLLSMADDKQRQDLAKILHYVVRIITSSEGLSNDVV